MKSVASNSSAETRREHLVSDALTTSHNENQTLILAFLISDLQEES